MRLTFVSLILLKLHRWVSAKSAAGKLFSYRRVCHRARRVWRQGTHTNRCFVIANPPTQLWHAAGGLAFKCACNSVFC